MKHNNKCLKITTLRLLRRIGWLCRKPNPRKKGVRISRTIMPDGKIIEHGGFVEKAPINNQSFQSELHIYHELKRDTEKKYNRPSKNK